MRRVIYALEAEADILVIARRIAADNLAAAEDFIEIIDTKAHLLLTAPEMGLRRDELAPGATELPGR